MTYMILVHCQSDSPCNYNNDNVSFCSYFIGTKHHMTMYPYYYVSCFSKLMIPNWHCQQSVCTSNQFPISTEGLRLCLPKQNSRPTKVNVESFGVMLWKDLRGVCNGLNVGVQQPAGEG